MPGLAILIPDHPQIAEIHDRRGDDPAKELTSNRTPDPRHVSGVHPDHLVADDASTPGLAGPAELHEVPDDDQQGAEDNQKDRGRHDPVIRFSNDPSFDEQFIRRHQRSDEDQGKHDGAIQHGVEEITAEAVAETNPAIGVVTPDIGATLGAGSLLTGIRWRWRRHVAHGVIVEHAAPLPGRLVAASVDRSRCFSTVGGER